ncbi:hypothetical protein FQA39_LY07533 [Lamprigera yunnana]|nr:hypothetical protein FQA39_LY07533 [Lamprigera yunnana]
MDFVLFVEFIENEIQSHLSLDQDPHLKLRIMLTSTKVNYLLLHIPNYWFFVLFKLEVMKRNLNIQRGQLRHSSENLTIPEHTLKGLFRISRELANWVFHKIFPYMREFEHTTAIPKNLRLSACSTTLRNYLLHNLFDNVWVKQLRSATLRNDSLHNSFDNVWAPLELGGRALISQAIKTPNIELWPKSNQEKRDLFAHLFTLDNENQPVLDNTNINLSNLSKTGIKLFTLKQIKKDILLSETEYLTEQIELPSNAETRIKKIMPY